MLYFEKTSDTTLSGSYISPKQHFDNIEDFKVTEETELFQIMHFQQFSLDKVWPCSWNILNLEIFCFLTTTPKVTTLNTVLQNKRISNDSEVVVLTRGLFLGVLVFGLFVPDAGLGKYAILFVMVNLP